MPVVARVVAARGEEHRPLQSRVPSRAPCVPVPQPTESAPADGLSRDAAALEGELAGVIVQALNLELTPAQIDAAAPLYGEGLGLDSIDILELALEVSQRYGFQLRADDENNQQIFLSLRTLAAHVAQHRTR